MSKPILKIFLTKIIIYFTTLQIADIMLQAKECIMKKSSHFPLGIIASILSLTLLCACNFNTDLLAGANKNSTSAQSQESHTDKSSETGGFETVAENTYKLKIHIKNVCGIDFGMFSMIDPATGEQLDLTSVSTNEILTLTADWPIGATVMQWSLYDTDGNLLIGEDTDISKASSEVFLTFEGDGKIEHFEKDFL